MALQSEVTGKRLEQKTRIPPRIIPGNCLYYAIFVVATGELEVYRLVEGDYQELQPDPYGHYPIEPFGVALGVWHGFYLNETAPWLRWYDLQGNLMPLDPERVAEVSRRLDEEQRRVEEQARLAEEQCLRAERLAAKLRELGIDPDQLGV